MRRSCFRNPVERLETRVFFHIFVLFQLGLLTRIPPSSGASYFIHHIQVARPILFFSLFSHAPFLPNDWLLNLVFFHGAFLLFTLLFGFCRRRHGLTSGDLEKRGRLKSELE